MSTDRFDRITEESYSNGVYYHYRYDAEGSLAEQYAGNNGSRAEQYAYDYDSLGRLIHSRESDGSGQMVQRTEHLYDTSDRLTAQNWMLRDKNVAGSQKYTYSTDLRGQCVEGSSDEGAGGKCIREHHV